MKKSLIIVSSVIMMMALMTATTFAAQNGFDAKADEQNPAFEESGQGHMVINSYNQDLHFSTHGHIMIPGEAGQKSNSSVVVPMGMHDKTHVIPTGYSTQFNPDHCMHYTFMYRAIEQARLFSKLWKFFSRSVFSINIDTFQFFIFPSHLCRIMKTYQTS
jgi:hypothetical protein